MEFVDGVIEDLSNDLTSHYDNEEDFIELCQLIADAGDDLNALLSKRPRDEATSLCSGDPSVRSSSTNDLNKKRKKDSVNSFKKIPKEDIRRCYPIIFKNAFNECEQEKFINLLSKYCTENCAAFYRFVGPHNPFGSFDHTEVLGIPAIAAYWEAIFSAIPDSLFDIVETKFRLLPDRQTSIVCKFLYSGTKVFKLATDDGDCVVYVQKPEEGNNSSSNSINMENVNEAMEQSLVDNNEVDASSLTSSTNMSQSSSCYHTAKILIAQKNNDQQQNERPFRAGEYLSQPQKVAIIGTFACYTNSDNKIFRFEFIYSIKQ